MIETFMAGAAEKDITPPLQCGFLASAVEGRWAPFESIRKPLKASALVVQKDGARLVLCSLDLLGLAPEAVFGWDRFTSEICRQAGISAGDLVITCTHTHTAPETLALSDLFRNCAYHEWLERLEAQIAAAIGVALRNLQPASVELFSGETEGLTLYRRIRTAEGIQLSHQLPVDRSKADAHRVDERVRGLLIQGGGEENIACLLHAVCHPVYEMCLPHVSGDYPGELREVLQARWGRMPVLFLNGAAGTINPWHVSGGADHARTHAEAIFHALERAERSSVSAESLGVHRRKCILPCRDLPGRSKTIEAELVLLAMEDLKVLFLPGEPFLETAQDLETKVTSETFLVTGYSQQWIGYIPLRETFAEGGYEAGPGKWSYLEPEAEAMLRREATELLNSVR